MFAWYVEFGPPADSMIEPLWVIGGLPAACALAGVEAPSRTKARAMPRMTRRIQPPGRIVT
jgi:hypothetical protein